MPENEPTFGVVSEAGRGAAPSLTGAAGAEGADAVASGAPAGAVKSAGAGFGAPDFSGSDMCVLVYERRLTLLFSRRREKVGGAAGL